MKIIVVYNDDIIGEFSPNHFIQIPNEGDKITINCKTYRIDNKEYEPDDNIKISNIPVFNIILYVEKSHKGSTVLL